MAGLLRVAGLLAGLRRLRAHPASWRRDPRWPRDFRHRIAAPLLTVRQGLALARSFPPTIERVGAGVPVVPSAPLPPSEPGTIAVTWLGHASTLIRVDGVTVLVDPVLGPGIPGARRRLTPPGIAVGELPRIDVLLVSHDHYDHLDAWTLARLPRTTRVVVGAGGGPWFARRGFTDVTELDWWSSVPVTARNGTRVDVEFVPARHWSRRGPFDTGRRLWGGWVVTGADGRAVYHAGDSGYGPFFARIGRRHRSVAVAVLPVGAYAPRRLLRPVHMDPAEAVRAADDVGAAAMVPVHWGTFVLSGEPVTEPLVRVRDEWARAGRAADTLWDLPVGGTRTT